MKIPFLEEIATRAIGDGQSPNLFFVSMDREGVMMISRDFYHAYSYWKGLPKNIETALEDRLWGVICSTEPKSETDPTLVTYDDSDRFLTLQGSRRSRRPYTTK